MCVCVCVNEIRDLTASLMREVCTDVEVEPRLQPLSGEDFVHSSANRDPEEARLDVKARGLRRKLDWMSRHEVSGGSSTGCQGTRSPEEARLDVKARGLWGGTFECAFFDVWVFNPRARSNEARRSTALVFRRHEQHKRRQYDQRFRDVEMASFTPLVFAASGGFGPSARVTFKHLASRLAAKLAMPYSAVMGWLQCRVCFSVLRSAVMCLRGSRQRVRGDVGCPAPAIAEGLACGCKLSKITTLACAVTMTTGDHKTREKLLPIARDSESRTVNLAATRTRCVKMTSSIGSTLQPWTAVSALWTLASLRKACYRK